MLDCLIIGNGIIALSLADQLAQAGKSVKIIERKCAGRSASWAAGGILPPPQRKAVHEPTEQLRALSHDLYPDWIERLQRASNIDQDFQRAGGIYLARSAGEAALMLAVVEDWQTDGVTVERISKEELAQLEPQLDLAGIRVAYRLPDEILVRPPRILKALRFLLQTAGVSFQEVTNVSLNQTNDRCRIFLDGIDHEAENIIVAAGPWSTEMLDQLGIETSVEPFRGQIAMWQMDQKAIQHIINEGPRYIFARNDNCLIAGSTVEEVGFKCETTTEGVDSLCSFASKLIPKIRDVKPTKTWAGLRPRSPDGIPLIGRVMGIDNLFVATGHFRSGIHLAPATAVCLSQEILGQTPTVPLERFSPRRN